MFAMTQHALKLAVGRSFTSPVELNDWLWPQVWEYGRKVSDNPALRATYALNALVAVDNAAWVLFARENGLKSFDEMIPGECRPALAAHHAKCASIPLFSYKVPVSEIKEAVDSVDHLPPFRGLPRWRNVKNLPANAGDTRDVGSIPGLGEGRNGP